MKSNYTYSVTDISGRNVIAIEDLNNGGMSVTNNIENVISEIENAEKIDAKCYMVIYKDSNGIFDGFDCKTGDFFPLNKNNLTEAITEYINQQLYEK